MSEGYSAYPEEDEVLIQDGLMYSVIAKEEIKLARNYSKPYYYLIKLQYPGEAQPKPERENRQETDRTLIGDKDNDPQII